MKGTVLLLLYVTVAVAAFDGDVEDDVNEEDCSLIHSINRFCSFHSIHL